MKENRFASFEEFWPFYVREHSRTSTRVLHVIGTSGALACIAAAAALERPVLAVMALAVGYGFAWIAHFFFQRNKPATFTYPLWSLRGDFKMFLLTLTGRMSREVRKATGIKDL